MRHKLRASIVALCVLAAAGCADQRTPTASQGPDPLVEYLVAMGFSRDQIVDAGPHFIVEGDMLIDKAELRRQAGTPGDPGHPARRPLFQQLLSSGPALQSAVQQIRVDLSAVAAENASWASATRQAMASWNALPGASVNFVEAAPAHITVSIDTNFDACVPAAAAGSQNGAVGNIVRINRSYLGSYSYAKQVLIMVHELGHTIGFGHTNSTAGTRIPGTPSVDPGSVMNAPSTGCPRTAPDWAGLSAYDEVAGIYLYPDRAAPAVSNAGGYPHVSWSAVQGATSYTVVRVVERTVEDEERGDSSETQETVVGTVSSPGLTDYGYQYTGYTSCTWYGYPVSEYESYSYRVQAQFPNGTTAGWVAAPIGPC